eukprot:815948_1
MINQPASGNSSAVDPTVVDEPVKVDAPPVEDAQAVDARWARRRHEIENQRRVPQWVWKAAAFVGSMLVVALLVAALASFITKSTYPKSLLVLANDASADSKFTAYVQQLLTNFANSPELITSPHNDKKKGFPNNPNPPTLQISPDVLANKKPTETTGGLCVPLSCSSNKTLTVKAMDFNTELPRYANGVRGQLSVPNLTPIP